AAGAPPAPPRSAGPRAGPPGRASTRRSTSRSRWSGAGRPAFVPRRHLLRPPPRAPPQASPGGWHDEVRRRLLAGRGFGRVGLGVRAAVARGDGLLLLADREV